MSNELEDHLAESLQACAAGVRTADVTGLAARARAGHRRRRLAIRGTATACAAAGTTAVLVATLAAPSAPGALNAQTAAYVTRMTEHALAATANDDFVFVRTTVGGPGAPVSYDAPGTPVASAENWSYGRQRRIEIYGAHGRPIADVAMQAGPNATAMTTVVYRSATWWRSDLNVSHLKEASATRCSPFALLYVPLGVTGPSASWPELFRRALACGQVVDAGRQVIDGQHVIRLEQKAPSAAFRSVYWVNSSTYLPVRIRTYNAETYAVHGKPWWQQEDFRWMRPTAANLAQLEVAIPAGFTRVSAPPYAGLVIILPEAAARLP
jgi:hypothetical protein